jgi:oxygen-independent coproporphyrinogen-3 oxidase
MTPTVIATTTAAPASPARASGPTSPRGIRSERHRVLAADGVELSLTRVAGTNGTGDPVVLTHGTFSNATICARLAEYLAGHRFDCWILELRGHGASQREILHPSFEAFGLLDVPAALEAIHTHTGQRVFLLGHSGGGLAYLMHLVREPPARAGVKGLVLLASQATEACATLRGRLLVAFGRLTDRVPGYTPGRALGLGPEDEPRGVLTQWYRWNRTRRWTGQDGMDYLAALGDLSMPALSIAGAGDWFIAPPAGCRRVHDALGGSDKTWVHASRAEGFSEDFGHARLIASRGAQREIWPRIRDWLVARRA